MKLFINIDPLNDCIALQNYVDKFIKWGQSFRFSLNIDKCKSMVLFTRNYNLIIFTSSTSKTHNLIFIFDLYLFPSFEN